MTSVDKSKFRSAIVASGLIMLLGLSGDAGAGKLADFAERNRVERAERILGKPRVRDEEHATRAVARVVAKKKYDVVDTGSAIFLGVNKGQYYFLTAYHVIEEANFSVEFFRYPGRFYEGKYIASYDDLDLAVFSVSYLASEISDRLIPFETGDVQKLNVLQGVKAGVAVRDHDPSGARITGVVTNSPAYLAGLETGDVIIRANGLTIRTAQQLADVFQAAAGGASVGIDLIRNKQPYVATVRVGYGSAVSADPVYTIGHPPGSKWTWQRGFLLSAEDRDYLRMTVDLVQPGVSGGPLFDQYYRVVGLVVKDGAGSDMALRIERALEKLVEWRIPYRFWKTPNFCSQLATVFSHRERKWGGSKFDGLKQGPSRNSDPEMSKYDSRVWDASVDISGLGKSLIVKSKSSGESYESIVGEAFGTDEARILQKEIARAVFTCYPDASVDANETTISISFKLGGAFSDVLKVKVHRFYTQIQLEID